MAHELLHILICNFTSLVCFKLLDLVYLYIGIVLNKNVLDPVMPTMHDLQTSPHCRMAPGGGGEYQQDIAGGRTQGSSLSTPRTGDGTDCIDRSPQDRL